MPHSLDEAKKPKKWIEYAKAELAIAEIPLPEGGFYEQFCFHAQQAAEKSLKGILVKLGVEFPFTHDLQLLLDILADDISVPTELYDIVELNAYSVMIGYPGASEPITEHEYSRAIQLARMAIEWAESII